MKTRTARSWSPSSTSAGRSREDRNQTAAPLQGSPNTYPERTGVTPDGQAAGLDGVVRRKRYRLVEQESRFRRASPPKPPSSSGLGHRPFKAAARVRIPLGAPEFPQVSTRKWGRTPEHSGLRSQRRGREHRTAGPPEDSRRHTFPTLSGLHEYPSPRTLFPCVGTERRPTGRAVRRIRRDDVLGRTRPDRLGEDFPRR